MTRWLFLPSAIALLGGCQGEQGSVEVDPKVVTVPVLAGAPEAGKAFRLLGIAIEMVWCQPGTFIMGGNTRHEVTLTKGFWLGKHEVTQTQWKKVMETTPSSIKGADRPVEGISWYDATKFCRKLTEMERAAGRLPEGWAYQLPTEAQWEYACRAGTTTAFAFGDTLSSSQANIRGRGTVPVGSYEANAWGFHDMHGNVHEWCHDWHGDYPSGIRDPLGALAGSRRIRRGGSWYFPGHPDTAPEDVNGIVARAAIRTGRVPSDKSPIQGFRVSLRLVQDSHLATTLASFIQGKRIWFKASAMVETKTNDASASLPTAEMETFVQFLAGDTVQFGLYKDGKAYEKASGKYRVDGLSIKLSSTARDKGKMTFPKIALAKGDDFDFVVRDAPGNHTFTITKIEEAGELAEMIDGPGLK